MKRYAIAVPTSMGVRITPANRQPVHLSHEYYLQATSAETNVASVPAALGMPADRATVLALDVGTADADLDPAWVEALCAQVHASAHEFFHP